MTLALATRGYLSSGVGGQQAPVGPGPVVSSAMLVKPEITDSKEIKPQGPKIMSIKTII